ncbi:hypothetical protein F5Y00DRAFT_229715 [Daldinia vernicosa]|uniref:uncharacterized protein n=1 Tax=Daldinia vernicosa TaxID=114800 RepID=UPI002007AD91|nr:uncharacterized protein F5Y00DRAFT_229715 [Daldinia vernicosa]KAI0851437.1 hypothetical protein F5Y00DRAFT_229715 [Daldinia vernicosa]
MTTYAMDGGWGIGNFAYILPTVLLCSRIVFVILPSDRFLFSFRLRQCSHSNIQQITLRYMAVVTLVSSGFTSGFICVGGKKQCSTYVTYLG